MKQFETPHAIPQYWGSRNLEFIQVAPTHWIARQYIINVALLSSGSLSLCIYGGSVVSEHVIRDKRWIAGVMGELGLLREEPRE